MSCRHRIKLPHKVDVIELVRTVTDGRSSVTKQRIATELSVLLEAQQPKNLVAAAGWIERASYNMTWIKDVGIRAGNIIVFQDSNHVVKNVRKDLQGNYFTAILEQEAK